MKHASREFIKAHFPATDADIDREYQNGNLPKARQEPERFYIRNVQKIWGSPDLPGYYFPGRVIGDPANDSLYTPPSSKGMEETKPLNTQKKD